MLIMQAKRTLVDVLTAAFADDDAVQVAYAKTADPLANLAIYLGGVRTTASDDVAEPGIVILEEGQCDIRVRAYRDDSDVRSAEQDLERLTETLVDLLATDPLLLGANTRLRVSDVVIDPPLVYTSPEPGVTCQARVTVYVGGDE